MYVISILAPILVIVSLGKILHDSHFLDSDFFSGCTKLVFWIGLPALLIYKIGNAQFDFAMVEKIIAVLFISAILIILISYISLKFMQLGSQKGRTFLHASFHCNISYIGLPIIFFALTPQAGGNALTEIASMAAGVMILFNNTVTMFIMSSNSSKITVKGSLLIVKRVILSPVILACIFGFLLSIGQIPIPYAVNRILQSLGNMSLPLALLGVGARLEFKNIHSNLKIAIFAAVLNSMVLPTLGFLIGKAFSLTNNELLIALILLSGPTASATYVYAREMDGDPQLASKVVLLSTFISILPLSLILYFFI